MNSKTSSEDKKKKFGLNSFKENWFSENSTLAEDFAWSIQVKNVIYEEKSKYHDILVFDSLKLGRCLALNNSIRCGEGDEFAYHEMITLLPLLSHPEPKKVLIIGGGDGGVSREVIKHPSVQSIVLCEMDEAVIQVCKRHLPFMAKGFQSSKMTISIGDGTEYIKNQKGQFDVIITDSSDPLGRGTNLFGKTYFESLKKALRPGGVIASRGGCYWFNINKVREFLATCRAVFPVVDYASTSTASFPGGQCGILLCGVSTETNFREPMQKYTTQTLKDFELRYYTPDVHRAAFAHPWSILKELGLREDAFLF